MTTTISAAPALDIDFLQPEDTMELASSPHMQQDDLDLDLDPPQEPESAPEDSMVEDTLDDDTLEVADNLDDDVMFDEDTAVQHFPHAVSDFHMETHHEHEEIMEDEDILYEDEEVLEESDLVQPANDFVENIIGSVDKQKYSAPISGDAEVSEAHLGDDFAFAEDPSAQSAFLPETKGADLAEDSNKQLGEDDPQGVIATNHILEAPENVDDETYANVQEQNTEAGLDLEDTTTNTNPADTTEALREAKSREQDLTDVANTSAPELAAVEPHTTSFETQDIALHTVRVIYQENEICLFPPHSEEGGETFFLSDHGLAHETIDNLLASCREVLAHTIGDDDELVLDFASLGLHISEGSKYAAEITLSQILDIYLKLSHNEGIEQIEPLYCNLSSRVCLASQYAYLAAAAQEGKTITEIFAEHIDSPEYEAAEDQPEYEERTKPVTNYREAVETSLPALDRSTLEDAHDEEEAAADADASEPLEGRNNDHLDITEENDHPAAFDSEERGDITDNRSAQEPDVIGLTAELSRDLDADDAGIDPALTEYEEDVDEVTNEDAHHSMQEQVPVAEGDVEAADAKDETASSGTVEAEITANQEQHLVENLEQADNHFEQYDDDIDQPSHESKGLNTHDQHLQISETGVEEFVSNEPEGDLLDLPPEAQDQSSSHQLDLADKIDETDFQYVEDNQDLFNEGDSSTDQTLDNTQGDDEDDLDVFLPPATPAKTTSTKRKVEADDEDDFGLLDTETPEKKRRRPS